MSWNPDDQECRSYFGYGSGFHMTEDHERAKRLGYAIKPETRMFCNRCPISTACWKEHQERIRGEDPAAAEAWDALVAKNQADGISPGKIAAALMHAGRPDPWMKGLLQNMKHGQEARDGMNA